MITYAAEGDTLYAHVPAGAIRFDVDEDGPEGYVRKACPEMVIPLGRVCGPIIHWWTRSASLSRWEHHSNYCGRTTVLWARHETGIAATKSACCQIDDHECLEDRVAEVLFQRGYCNVSVRR